MVWIIMDSDDELWPSRYQVFTPTSGNISETQFSDVLLIRCLRDEMEAILQIFKMHF